MYRDVQISHRTFLFHLTELTPTMQPFVVHFFFCLTYFISHHSFMKISCGGTETRHSFSDFTIMWCVRVGKKWHAEEWVNESNVGWFKKASSHYFTNELVGLNMHKKKSTCKLKFWFPIWLNILISGTNLW